MKKWVAFLFICCLVNSFSQTNISPQFSELKGMEDQQGDSHLFYRIYEYFSNQYGFSKDNSIYHIDITNAIDSFFISDYINDFPAYQVFKEVKDFEFWDKDFTKFIYVGSEGGFEIFPYVRRFDEQYIILNYLCCSVENIDISNNDDSLVYAGGFISYEGTIKSSDGGFNWDPVADTLMFLSLNSFDDDVFFLENHYGFLYRSTDAGNTFNLVDLLTQPGSSKSFLYDSDQLHIYRIFGNKTLRVSPNNGEPYSWQTKYSSDSEIFISIDESISGTIYLADKKNIFVSTNYGDNFTLYKTLERNIVGIYKKPNSNKLYAATKYKIYEITPDTIQVIKSLPIPEEILNYYPLSIGNKWVYDYIIVPDDPFQQGDSGIYIREVLQDTTMANGKLYSKIFDETLEYGPNIVFERVDTLSGKVYRYFEDTTLVDNEYLIHDLLAEVGDTISGSRYFFYEEIFTIVLPNSIFNKWGITKPKKVYQEYTLGMYSYSLTEEIGLDSIYFIFDFGFGRSQLKGCLIDGVIYGDTTTVGVEDEESPIVNEFKLEQNYPNPFNPTTNIGFRIADRGFVTLKVYDVLGNEVATLVNEELPAGEYEVEFQSTVGSRQLTSGFYFYNLKAGEFNQTKKMIILK